MKSWSNSDIPGAGEYVPEKRLLAAVLQRAITDFLTGEGDLKESSRLWLLDLDIEDCPLTFSFICEALDLDAGNLRKEIFKQAKVALPEDPKKAAAAKIQAKASTPQASIPSASVAVAEQAVVMADASVVETVSVEAVSSAEAATQQTITTATIATAEVALDAKEIEALKSAAKVAASSKESDTASVVI